MRRNKLLATLLLYCGIVLLPLQATELTPNLKFGKPTEEELSMTVYAPDSNATAVALCRITDAEYEWGMDDFRITYRYKNRIKILKDEGTSYANVSIIYYDSKKSRQRREILSGLEAYAYNVEGGKVVRTKMKKEQVFQERLNDYYMQAKFTVPQVKSGTVIEYEYQILSDFYYEIREWKAQEDIPTFYTQYDITIPEYFRFNTEMHGTARLSTQQESANASFSIGGNILQCAAERKIFIGNKLPAIKADKYVWCADNYCTQVNFELLRLEFPGMLHKNFTQSWENIDKMLLDDEDFGGRLRGGNPFEEETERLGLRQLGSVEEKVTAACSLLKSHIKWNGKYALYGKNARQVVKEGTGNNAELNFILINLLKDLGVEAYPVVMSRRNQPMLPYAHPSLQKLTTFIVAVALPDNQYAFLDPASGYGPLNVLPPVLMSSRARMVIPDNRSIWVDLQSFDGNLLRVNINLRIAPDGIMTGTRITSYNGQHAARFKQTYHAEKDSLEYLRKLSEKEEIQVQEYHLQGTEPFSPTVQETIAFTKQATTNDDLLYVNPLVFMQHAESPFKQSDRQLPVEFSYKEKVNVNVLIDIPEGYVVDELPQSTRLATQEKQLTGLYHIVQQGNKVNLRYNFTLGQLLFIKEQYPELQHFWELLAEKNNALMILKKI